MGETGTRAAEERLLAAERARRSLIVRLLAIGMSVASVAAWAVSFVQATVPWAVMSVGASAVVFAGVYLLARRMQDPFVAAVIMLVTMQLEHVGSTIGNHELSQLALTMTFSSLCPLIAAATLGLRATGVVGAVAVAAVMMVTGLELRHAGDDGAVIQAMAAPLFFVIAAWIVSMVFALAGRRSMKEHVEEVRAAERERGLVSEAAARFRALADQVSDLVAVLDVEGKHTFVSASYRRILGVEPADLVGRAAPELVHEEDAPRLGEAFARAQSGEPREVVVRLRTEDGSLRQFLFRLAGVEVDGKPHVALAARDVTELQDITAHEESSRRMEALTRLAGGVAHDFNNLLVVIGSCTAFIDESLEKDHEVREDLAVIDEAIQQATGLTGQLLAFAKGQLLSAESAVPAEVVKHAGLLLDRTLGKGQELVTDAASSSWQTAISSGQLEQILMNLAVNARDAMPDGGKLTVRVRDRSISGRADLEDGDYVLVEVSDTGAGMSPAVASHIFEPFFTTKGGRRGTGLGLATCFGIATQLGGTLEVESDPGVGSTFRLYLPRVKEKRPEASQPERAEGGRSILVVDDEPAILSLVSRLLTRQGHSPVTASNMAEAIACTKERAFDVFLTDIVLGPEDGLELLEILRGMRVSAGAVVMSGYAPSHARLAALRRTGVEFVPKPFSAAQLAEAIERACVRAQPRPGESVSA